MKKVVCVIGLAMLAAACGPEQKVMVRKDRYFWPPPPSDPKIEFIDMYHTSYNLPQKESFWSMLTGSKEPEYKLRKPLAVGADGDGLVVVTDMIPFGGYVWDLKANKVEPISKGPSFQLASGVAFDATRIYISDAKSGGVKVFSKKDREPLYVIGDEGVLESPNGLAVNEKLGRLYVVDTKKGKVMVFDIQTKAKLFEFGRPGDQEGEFNRAWGIAIEHKTDEVIVADGLNARIQIFDKDGKFLSMFGKRGDKAGGFSQVKGVGIDSEGHIYVIDPLKALQVFSKSGDLLGLVGAPGNKGVGAMSLPMGLYVDKNDRIYVVDQMNRRFHVYQYLNEEYRKKNPVVQPERKQ